MFVQFLVFIISVYMFLYILEMLLKKSNELICIMGKAGSGKSTLMAHLVKKSLKKKRIVYTNHHVKGAQYLEPAWLGKFMLQDVDIIIDEAQIEFDNRDFKSFTKELKFFFSNYRHFKCRIWIISQSWEDLDVKIRRQAHKIYIMQPSFIPFTIMLQKVHLKLCVNQDGSDIVNMFKTGIFDLRFKLNFTVWHYFDSYQIPFLPPIPIVKLWSDAPISRLIVLKERGKEYARRALACFSIFGNVHLSKMFKSRKEIIHSED